MGANDPNLDIKVKVSGTDQGTRDLDKTASGLQKLKGASDSATAATGKLTGEQKKFFDGLKKVGSEVPVVGALLNALKNPWTTLGFAIAVVVVAVQNFLTKIDEMAQEIKRFDSINLALKNWATATAEAAASNRDFAESINEIIRGVDNAEKRFGKTKDKIGAAFGTERDLAEKTKAFELAQIEADVQSGKMTPEQGIRAKGAIELRHAADERERTEREILARKNAAIIGNREAAADRAAAEGELPGLEAAVGKAGQQLKRRMRFQGAFEAYAAKERPSLVSRIEGQESPWGRTTEWMRRVFMGEQLSPQEQLDALDLGLDQAGALVENAQSDFDSAKRAFGAGRARVSGAVTSQMNLYNTVNQEGVNMRRAWNSNTLLGPIGDATTKLDIDAAVKRLGDATVQALDAQTERIRRLEQRERTNSQSGR